MTKFLNSVRCAWQGVRYALASEKNIRVMLAIFVCVSLASAILAISRLEFLLILVVSAVIFSLELANTAIERLADRVSTQHDEQIGRVKDIMAGAVLLASIFAAVIGLLIFYEPLLKIMQH